MGILCERMMEQHLYASAAVLVAENSGQGLSQDLSRETSLKALLGNLAGHLAGEVVASGVRPGGRVREDSCLAPGASLLAGDVFESLE
jgi:hypothetical protein